jgi:hypothetical protein
LRPSAAPPLTLLQLLQVAVLHVHVVPPLGMLPTVQEPASELDEPDPELDDPAPELDEPAPELDEPDPELDDPAPELEFEELELELDPPELEAVAEGELASEAPSELDPLAPDMELEEPWPELEPALPSAAPELPPGPLDEGHWKDDVPHAAETYANAIVAPRRVLRVIIGHHLGLGPESAGVTRAFAQWCSRSRSRVPVSEALRRRKGDLAPGRRGVASVQRRGRLRGESACNAR